MRYSPIGPDLFERLLAEGSNGCNAGLEVLGHLLERCPESRAAYERFLADHPEAPLLGSASRPRRSPGEQLAELAQIASCRRRAEADWKELSSYKVAERKPRIERAHKRFRNLILADRLIEESKRTVRRSPQEAYELAECARVVALRSPAEPFGLAAVNAAVARAMVWRANALRVMGDLTEAERGLHQAEEILRGSNAEAPLIHAELQRNLASLRILQRRDAEAEVALRESIEAYRSLGDEATAALVSINLAEVVAETQSLEQGVTTVREAMGKLDEPETRGPFLGAVLNLGRYLHRLERFEEAEELLRRHAASLRDLGDRDLELRASWLSALIQREKGAVNEAAALLSRLQEKFLAEDRGYTAALVGLDLGLAYLKAGRHRELAELALSLIPSFVSRNLPQDALATFALLGDAARQEEISEKLLLQAQELASRPGIA